MVSNMTALLTSQNGTHLQNWVASEVVILRDGVGRGEAVSELQTKNNKALAVLSPSQQINPFIRSAQQVNTALDEMAATPTHNPEKLDTRCRYQFSRASIDDRLDRHCHILILQVTHAAFI